MKNILGWAKSNLLAVLSVVVVIVAIVALFLGNAHGKQIAADAAKRKSVISEIERLARTPLELLPENPGDEPRRVEICLNDATVLELTGLYERMHQEYQAIYDEAVALNREEVSNHPRYGDQPLGHLPMLDNLLPSAKGLAAPYNAKGAYRDAFRTMLGSYTSRSPYPNLNSGMPPFMEDIQDDLGRIVDDFLQRNFVDSEQNLTDEQATTLRQTLEARATEMLTQKAQSIHIYATQPLEDDQFSEEFPFDVGVWSEDVYVSGEGTDATPSPPSMAEIWEGQMGLWIQQDIVEAIARLNQVEDPKMNVMKAPVKQLVSIEVIEGYIGIDSKGEVPQQSEYDSRSMGMDGDMEMEMMASPRGGGLFALEDYEPVTPTDGDEPLDEDFSVSHTGRRSNAIYDVRQVRLTVRVDFHQLPRFFDVLSEVNFMTVVSMNIQDVDEYDALLDGFVYGEGDVVEVEALIETVWLRDWTKAYMPNRIKSLLGILKPDDEGYVNPFDDPRRRGMGSEPGMPTF